MSSKLKALLAAIAASLAGLINWLATVPPEQQSGWVASLVEITPVQYRPNVGLFTRFLMFFLTIYVAHKASQSGPQTPPKNPPQ